MAVDPAARAVLDLIEELGVPPLDQMSPEQARVAFDAMRDPDAPVADVASVTDRELAGVPCRIYVPHGSGPFGVVMWIHGGGWVIGSADQSDPTARELCDRAGVVVVSVDYRLAPEHPFPAAVDDVLAVAGWLRDHGDELGADARRLAVGGDSAGGNLAAVVTQQMPGVFAHQVLIYPATDATMSSPSIEENAEGYLLERASMVWFYDHYLGGAAEPVDRTDTRVSPAFATDEVISAQPPTLVLTCGYDPLRDEGVAYAERLAARGVPVQHLTYPDQIHGMFGMHLAIPAADEALTQVAAALRTALA